MSGDPVLGMSVASCLIHQASLWSLFPSRVRCCRSAYLRRYEGEPGHEATEAKPANDGSRVDPLASRQGLVS